MTGTPVAVDLKPSKLKLNGPAIDNANRNSKSSSGLPSLLQGSSLLYCDRRVRMATVARVTGIGACILLHGSVYSRGFID
jgi:hypothetical protein